MFLHFLPSPKSLPGVDKLILIWNYLDKMTASSTRQNSATPPQLKPDLTIIGTGPFAKSINKVQTLLERQRFAEAEQAVRALVARFPHHGFCWKLLGVGLLKQ